MDRSQQFLEMFRDFIDLTTDPEYNEKNYATYYKKLAEFCQFFNVSRAEMDFYRSANDERMGISEHMVAYDNGRGNKLIHGRTIITKSKAIIRAGLYVNENDDMLPEEDMKNADLVLRCVLSFISRNRLQATVEMLGFYDESGYRNMRFFNRYLFQLNARTHLKGYAAVRFNLRHFGLVNNDIGRVGGDLAMKGYFGMFEELIGDNGTVCRMGGDNFVAIFEACKLEEIMKLLSGVPVSCGENRRILVSSTAGVYIVPDDFVLKTPDDIMDKISAAAQDAKSGEGDCISTYNEEIVMQREKVMKVQSLFGDALKNKEFYAYYQPQVDVTTGRIVGAEALCRWFHGGKMVMPMDFIPMLEQNSDICRLDFYMLDMVCRDIRRWMYGGRKVVRVSVNLSRKHLMDIDLVSTILGIIDRNFVPREYIEIELTESIGFIEFENLKNIIRSLQEAGISTSVDDFGVGYSSLNLLRQIPWNVLKVDRCFLPTGDESSEVTGLMFRHVVNMAHDIGLKCIAEGVETAEQIELLKANNCRIAQGFFFDKPLPSEEFEKKLGEFSYYNR
ncbi:MAG: EAL domain-containing protein [Oscillospiraceae bacterium]|nr:EAL domain-containing protein [Oscillospiraceae bacterium]